MQYYSAKLRLSGSTMNEVRDVYSAPEILLLQYIHGADSVSDLKKVAGPKNPDEKKMKTKEYKEYLKTKYDVALGKTEQSIDQIFGALGQLPTTLPDDLLERHDIVDEDDVIAVAKNVTKNDKKANGEHQPQTSLEADRLDKLVPQDEINMDDLTE